MHQSKDRLQARITELDRDIHQARHNAELARNELVREIADKLRMWIPQAVAEVVEDEFQTTQAADSNGSLPGLKQHIKNMTDKIPGDISAWFPDTFWPHHPTYDAKSPNEWHRTDYDTPNPVLHDALDKTLYKSLRKLLSQYGYHAKCLSSLDVKQCFGRFNVYFDHVQRVREDSNTLDQTRHELGRLQAREAWSKA